MFMTIHADKLRSITQIESQIDIPLRYDLVVKLYILNMELPEEFDILLKQWMLDRVFFDYRLHLRLNVNYILLYDTQK